MSLKKTVSIALPILASTAYVVELSFVPLILPSLQADLGLDRTSLAWVFNAYVAAVAVGVLVGGRLGDSIGPRRVFSMGVLLFVCGSMFVGLSEEHTAIVAGRIVQGFGGGLFSPVIPVLLARAAEPRPGRLLILWGSISGLVAGLVPLAVHYIFGAFHWSVVFFALAGAALPALLIGLTNIQIRTEQDAPKVSLLNALRQPARVWSLYAYVFCSFATIMLFIFMLPLSLNEAGFSPIQQAWVMLIFWVVFALAGVFLRNLVDQQAIWMVLLVSPVFVFAGFWVFILGTSPLWIGLSAALVGVGFACGNATSTTLILRFCREGTQSMAASIDISIARLGAALVILIAAPLNPLSVATLVAVLCVATAVFGWLPSPLLRMRSQRP